MHAKPTYDHPAQWYASELHARAAGDVTYPEGVHEGRGIVTVAGGRRYLPGAWASAFTLRALGVSLPIQMWYFGDEECDDYVKSLFETLDVECVDAKVVLARHPSKSLSRPNGTSRFARFELKCYAILHSPFDEVLFLDADNIPLRNPSTLFDEPEYKLKGALFWPDPPYGARPLDARSWNACGLPMQPGPSFESGQLLVHKRRCWKQLQLCAWMNEESDYWFSLLYGDKDSYKVAWHVTGAAYALAPMPRSTFAGILQHAPDGGTMFYHRWFRKPRLSDRHLGLPVANHSVATHAYAEGLAALRAAWDGRLWMSSGTGSAPASGLYRCSIGEDSFSILVRKNGTLASPRRSIRWLHAGDLRGTPCVVLEGEDRVMSFLRQDGASWIGMDADGTPCRLSATSGGLFPIIALRACSIALDTSAFLRWCMQSLIRAIEVVAVTIAGDDVAGSIRQFCRDVAALVRSDVPHDCGHLMTPVRSETM